MSGLHHSFYVIEASLLADPEYGVNFLLPIWSMANVAQGGAGLAVFLKTKNAAIRKIAIPASLTAFLGIVEPVMFGVNLKLARPFIGASIGGAIGGIRRLHTRCGKLLRIVRHPDDFNHSPLGPPISFII